MGHVPLALLGKSGVFAGDIRRHGGGEALLGGKFWDPGYRSRQPTGRLPGRHRGRAPGTGSPGGGTAGPLGSSREGARPTRAITTGRLDVARTGRINRSRHMINIPFVY